MRPIVPSDEEAVAAFLTARWGTRFVTLDRRAIDAARLPGFVVEAGDGIAGLVTLMEEHDYSEIVTIDATTPLRGLGTLLLDAAVARTKALDRAALKVRTSNDDLHALRFFQRRGFRIVGVFTEAIVLDRLADPTIPEHGKHGIPLRDEILLMRYIA